MKAKVCERAFPAYLRDYSGGGRGPAYLAGICGPFRAKTAGSHAISVYDHHPALVRRIHARGTHGRPLGGGKHDGLGGEPDLRLVQAVAEQDRAAVNALLAARVDVNDAPTAPASCGRRTGTMSSWSIGCSPPAPTSTPLTTAA